MKLLISTTDLDTFKSNDKIPLECNSCAKTFYKRKGEIKASIAGGHNRLNFCCHKCYTKSESTRFIESLNGQIFSCLQCIKYIDPTPNVYASFKKYGKNFCCHSCSTTYNNTHKTIGYRRSKLEVYIQEQLKKDYLQLQIIFNDKTAINSELDIYIPSLRLAFELNGIFHYEPIYSDKQFNQIQNNDKLKIIRCYEKGIELCIIDTSQLKQFKPERARKYYDIIISIINGRL